MFFVQITCCSGCCRFNGINLFVSNGVEQKLSLLLEIMEEISHSTPLQNEYTFTWRGRSRWRESGLECANILFFPFFSQNINVHVGALAVVCIVLCLSIVLLICLPWLATVRRCGGALALFVWGTLYTTAIVFIFTGGPVTAWEQVRKRRKIERNNRFISGEHLCRFHISAFVSISGGVFPLPLSERVHGAASLSGLGSHVWNWDQRFTHHHHQRLRPCHEPRLGRPGRAGNDVTF